MKIEDKFKTDDIVLYLTDIYTVVWIDDTGVTGLIGLRGTDSTTIVVSYLDKMLIKVNQEEN